MGSTLSAVVMVYNISPLIAFLVTAVVSYLLGCINGSILVSKLFFHDDIRKHGSGNAGLTNFYRTYGVNGVAGVLLSDILKAVAAVLIGAAVFSGIDSTVGKLIATTFVLIGHMYPFTFGFKGGKGVLSGFSAIMVINWKIGLILILIFIVIVALTRYVSLGSVCAALCFVALSWVFYHSAEYTLLAVIPVALLIFAHRANIVRLAQGKENKFSLHKKKTEGE